MADGNGTRAGRRLEFLLKVEYGLDARFSGLYEAGSVFQERQPQPDDVCHVV